MSKILIVDDSKTMRMIVKKQVKAAGFGSAEILEAGNGLDAYNLLKTAEVDLILCDWNMPMLNGINFLKKLQSDGRKIPFGFVTSEGTDEMKTEARENGANFYIVKPFTGADFKDHLSQFI